MSTEMVAITFEYKLKGGESWVSLPITDEEYFDRTERERPQWDSLPDRFDPREYVAAPRTEITRIRITIDDPSNDARLQVHECYWAAGANRLTERVSRACGKVDVEVSYSCSIPGDTREEVLRLRREGDWLLPEMHVFIRHQPGGPSETHSML